MPNVLFIQYDGGKKPTTIKGVSQHQHAAREFHRREKLKRNARRLHFAQSGKNLYAPTKSPHVKEVLDDEQPIEGRPRQLLTPLSSPQTVIGEGRMDPFNAFCTKDVPVYVHEILDHALSHQWAVFRATEDQVGLNEVKADIMSSVMISPLAFHTVIFAAATHNAYQYGSQGTSRRYERLRLLYKNKAISCMSEELRREGDNVSDATLLSMITLAAHGSGERLKRSNSATKTQQPSLLTAHNVDYYTSMDTGWEHLTAVRLLIDQRGGLSTIRLRSVAISIQ